MSSTVLSATNTRVERLTTFQTALTKSKGRSDTFKALDKDDRKSLLKIIQPSMKILSSKNIATINWDKAKSRLQPAIVKLIRTAQHQPPLAKAAAKTHLQQKNLLKDVVGSKQLMTQSSLIELLSLKDLAFLRTTSQHIALLIAGNAKHFINKYNLAPLIKNHCTTQIKSDAGRALNELTSLTGELSNAERVETLSYRTFGDFFNLVEAGNLIRICNEIEDHHHHHHHDHHHHHTKGAHVNTCPHKNHGKLSIAERTEDPDQQTINKEIFQLAEAGNLTPLANALEKSYHQHLQNHQPVEHIPVYACVPKKTTMDKSSLANLIQSQGHTDKFFRKATKFKEFLSTFLPCLQLANTPDIQLGFAGIGLTLIPNEVEWLTQSTTLSLHSNRLTFLNKKCVKLKDLNRICLGNNRFRKFPNEILQLPKLSDINMSFNRLTTLPKELILLQNLTSINLAYNYLKTFPGAICKLPKLKRLNLTGNHLSSLPDELGQLNGLKKQSGTSSSLLFKENGLVDLPKSLSGYSDQLSKQNKDLQAKTVLTRLRNSLKKTHDCQKIAELLLKLEKFNKAVRTQLEQHLRRVCKSDPKLTEQAQAADFGKKAFVNPKIDPKLKLKAIEQLDK